MFESDIYCNTLKKDFASIIISSASFVWGENKNYYRGGGQNSIIVIMLLGIGYSFTAGRHSLADVCSVPHLQNITEITFADTSDVTEIPSTKNSIIIFNFLNHITTFSSRRNSRVLFR
jgi:hypothetical protein